MCSDRVGHRPDQPTCCWTRRSKTIHTWKLLYSSRLVTIILPHRISDVVFGWCVRVVWGGFVDVQRHASSARLRFAKRNVPFSALGVRSRVVYNGGDDNKNGEKHLLEHDAPTLACRREIRAKLQCTNNLQRSVTCDPNPPLRTVRVCWCTR